MAYRPKDRIWAPAALTSAAVTLAEMKAHLRVDHNEEDALITEQALAATATAEKWTQRLLVRRAATLRLPGLPAGFCGIELPGGVVASVESVTVEGAPVTGAVAYGESPALLVPAADWPVVTADGYPVVISYTVGFSTVPADLKTAVKMIAADLYEHRGHSSADGAQIVPVSAEWLMRPHRIRPA